MVKRGSIYKISVKNFVTYSDVVIYPGPNLNVIIGPNGTGKSTIVAAIILGLGGTPKTIGRGQKVSEYVRNNCSDATIDIELYGNSPTEIITISRNFNTKNQNVWKINKKNCTETDVKNMVKDLNIQVHNLCQFLPQDRVQDFAKMNKKELLTNTQIAVGRQDLVDKHQKLINFQQDQDKLKKDYDMLNKKLDQAEKDNSRLENKVKNFQEKKKYIEDIDHVKRKISWLKYEKLLSKVQDIETDLEKANEIMNKHKKKIQPIDNKIAELNRQLTNLERRKKDEGTSVKESERKINSLVEQIENVQRSQRELYCEMKVKIDALKDSQNEILAKQAKVDKLINDQRDILEKHGEEQNLQERLYNINNQITKVSSTIEQMDRDRSVTINRIRYVDNDIGNLERNLKDMENLKSQRLEILKRKDRDAYSAVLWLRENKHMFSGKVYEPILIELDVFKERHSKYLENLIPMRDRVAFTCESREDMNLLLKVVRDQKGLNINALHSGPEHPPLSSYKPNIPIERLQQYGLYAYCASLFTTPEAIMKYLCRMYSLHNIPVGDESTYKKSQHVPPQIRCFFSENHRFYNTISRYTGEKSTRINNVNPDGTFSICVNLDAVNKMKRELDAKKREKMEMQHQCDSQQNEKQEYLQKKTQLYEEKRTISSVIESIRSIKDQISSSKRALSHFIQNNPSEEDIKRSYGQKIKNSLGNYLKKHENLISELSTYNDAIKSEALLKEEINTVVNAIAYHENETANLREQYETAKRSYNKIEEVHRIAKSDSMDALRHAKNLSEGFKPDDRGFSKFKEKFDSLPRDETTLRNNLDELQTKVNCMSTADDSEIAEYEKALNTIETLRARIDEITPLLTNIKERQETLYREWMEPLQELVGQINKNFSNYFESMGCAGEVDISKEKGEAEYSEYGLAIRVTYRKEDHLQELNRHTQSGGERAVATAVFMLSMQDLTTVPFRCVDEINQGMDPQNERRIFEILVKATTKEDSGQYFLITPKLIPSLNFGEGMKIHTVHNAPSRFLNVGDKNITLLQVLKNIKRTF